MEEVDDIILKTIANLGCDIEKAVSLSQLSAALIVEGTALCLKAINNDISVPHQLPPSMAARFRVGNVLSKAVQDLGYRGDIGYQTFLYANEADLRRVFMFLIEKLPKEAPQGLQQSSSSTALLENTIRTELNKWLQSPWLPSHVLKGRVCWRGKPPSWQRQSYEMVKPAETVPLTFAAGMETTPVKLPKETLRYYLSQLPYVTAQPPRHQQLAPSVLERSSLQLAQNQDLESEWSQHGAASGISQQEYKLQKKKKIEDKIKAAVKESLKNVDKSELNRKRGGIVIQQLKSTAFGDVQSANTTSASTIDKKEAEEAAKRQQEEEMENFKIELEKIEARLKQMDEDMNLKSSDMTTMMKSLQELAEQRTEKERVNKLKQRTLELLPDAEVNIVKLQQLVDSSSQRLVQLAEQWEKHRKPLLDQYRQLKSMSSSQKSETEQKLQEIKDIRTQIKALATEARGKEELLKQLVKEYEQLSKDINRSAYTRRILEIINNIKKQQFDIDKVLIDTKQVQKEINYLTGKLDRTFTVTDELVFQNAKTDDAARRAYKLLASLHETCQQIITTVQDTGQIMRDIRDLEEQVEHKSKNKVLANLEKITADFMEMKKENANLLAKQKQPQS